MFSRTAITDCIAGWRPIEHSGSQPKTIGLGDEDRGKLFNNQISHSCEISMLIKKKKL